MEDWGTIAVWGTIADSGTIAVWGTTTGWEKMLRGNAQLQETKMGDNVGLRKIERIEEDRDNRGRSRQCGVRRLSGSLQFKQREGHNAVVISHNAELHPSPRTLHDLAHPTRDWAIMQRVVIVVWLADGKIYLEPVNLKKRLGSYR
jgi:hypothetical protein